MDFCVEGTSIIADHLCTIIWDGMDGDYSVYVIDYTEEQWGGPWGGTFINDVRLLPEVPSLLRHGDVITFLGEDPMGEDEDMRFKFIRCTHTGWKRTTNSQHTSGLRHAM